MRRFVLSAVLLFLWTMQAVAEEEKTYYRIMSAKTTFAGKCIQDHTNNSNGADDFLIEDWDADNRRQEWELIPAADSAQYYIRNRATRKYIGQATTLVNKFYYTQLGTMQTNSPAWTVTDIGDGLVTFNMTDEYGVVRFLNAADTSKSPERIYSAKSSKKSGFAWRLVDATADPTAIGGIKAENVTVAVLSNKIVVNGCNDYTVHDMQGRQVSGGKRMAKGIYIVTAKGKSFKVLIK